MDGISYTLQWAALSPKIAPSHGGSGPHGSLGPAESTTQAASQWVKPFLQASRSWQTDRPTDHATL